MSRIQPSLGPNPIEVSTSFLYFHLDLYVITFFKLDPHSWYIMGNALTNTNNHYHHLFEYSILFYKTYNQYLKYNNYHRIHVNLH